MTFATIETGLAHQPVNEPAERELLVTLKNILDFGTEHLRFALHTNHQENRR
jgi:hypothetical protein